MILNVISTYQTNKKEKDLKAPTESCYADDVTVADRGHGDHEEVDTVPIGKTLTVQKVRRISRVLKLQRKKDSYPLVSVRFIRSSGETECLEIKTID